MAIEKQYIPAPQSAEKFNQKLGRLSGFAPNGQPRLRVVWGMDEKTFRAGNPSAIKYPSYDKTHVGMPFWILEQWYPPTMFDPIAWETDRFENGVDLMGEFPSNGFYGMLTPLFNENHEYLPLSGDALLICKQIIKSREDRQLDQTLMREKELRTASLEKQYDAQRQTERENEFDRYFSRKDFYENSREYSFASGSTIQNGERRSPAGLILPN